MWRKCAQHGCQMLRLADLCKQPGLGSQAKKLLS
eukprot:CAMPEP_0202389160 /NCGR_PEP_ID=MMETSP1127-20130417/81369_1 /ASSEMBLY_ACC=CAM_ASM_000462 /TAXON_ID=3047 /ORGANISM="Dunaliella tertiolecta, Strain CCMP1320" /LENGTH=33 /DNA_ID= /DNA_START= /DNA_END= /DNA_ORIENTATION=